MFFLVNAAFSLVRSGAGGVFIGHVFGRPLAASPHIKVLSFRLVRRSYVVDLNYLPNGLGVFFPHLF